MERYKKAYRAFWAAMIAAGLFASIQVFGQPKGNFQGTLSLTYMANSNTVNYVFNLLSDPPFWELSLTSSNEHLETFSSADQTVVATVYPGTSLSGGLNSATLKVFPGGRPFDARAEEHIWLALLSGPTFVEKPAPFRDPGICMGEPVVISRLTGSHLDSSPRLMLWHNERSDGKDGWKVRMDGWFEWLVASNIAGEINIPLDSTLSIAVTNIGLVTKSHLTISGVSSLNARPRKAPGIRGRWNISDARLDDVWRRNYITYQTTKGQIPATSDPVVQAAYKTRAAWAGKRSAKNPHESSTINIRVITLLSFLTVTGVFLVLMFRKAGKT